MTKLALLILFSLRAFAGDWLPTLPREIVCTTKFQAGRTLAEIALDAYHVPEEDDPSVMRQKLIDQVVANHVAPALRDGCANRSMNGLQILSAAKDACREGCGEESKTWPLNRRERAAQIELCQADCRAGSATAVGFAFGVASARAK